MDAREGAPRRGTSGAQGRRPARGRVAVVGVTSAVRGHLGVAPSCASACAAAALELGYEPNLLARSLSRGATGLDRVHGAGDREPRRGARPARRRGRAAGGGLRPRHRHRRGPRRPRRGLRAAAAPAPRRRVRAGARRRRATRRRATELERVQVPCVLYDRQVEWLDASCVLLDHAPSARVAGAHLLSLGHRRIAFVAGTPTVRVTPELEHGLRTGDGGRAGCASCWSRTASSARSTGAGAPSSCCAATRRRRR